MLASAAVLAPLLAPLLALAAAGLQAVDLGRADDSHSWRPAAADVARLERVVRIPEGMGGPLAQFDRYYTGVFRGGRRLVALELVNMEGVPPGGGRVRVVSPRQVPLIADGGCGVVRLAYDPATHELSAPVCNTELIPPPPPAPAPPD